MTEFTQLDSEEFLSATYDVLDEFLSLSKQDVCPIHHWMCAIFASSIVEIFKEIRMTGQLAVDKNEVAMIIHKSITKVVSDFASSVIKADIRDMH